MVSIRTTNPESAGSIPAREKGGMLAENRKG